MTKRVDEQVGGGRVKGRERREEKRSKRSDQSAGKERMAIVVGGRGDGWVR